MGKFPQLAKYKTNLAIRDGKECWYCGESMEKSDLTVEHLLAVSDGGSSNVKNLVLACAPHNKMADNMPISYKVNLRERLRGMHV